MNEQNTPAQDRLLTPNEQNACRLHNGEGFLNIEKLLNNQDAKTHRIDEAECAERIKSVTDRMMAANEEAIQKVLDSQDERIKQARQELIAEIESQHKICGEECDYVLMKRCLGPDAELGQCCFFLESTCKWWQQLKQR